MCVHWIDSVVFSAAAALSPSMLLPTALINMMLFIQSPFVRYSLFFLHTLTQRVLFCEIINGQYQTIDSTQEE